MPGSRHPWRARRVPVPTVEEISAGGLVVERADGISRVALIARLNRAGKVEWCLPKGHLEGSETPEQAAVREIHEETGILGQIIESLGTIDYWFSVEGRRIHKSVHHFLLQACQGSLSLEGDPDHEAIDVAWVALEDLAGRLAFPNERKVAELAVQKLASWPW